MKAGRIYTRKILGFPPDFTPVCTTEFMTFASMIDEFRNYVLKATSGYLVGMGIYPNIAGYTHLLSTIYIAAKRGLRGLSVCELYSEAGRTSGKSGAAVERAIRNAINKCVAEGRLHVLNGYFGHEIFSEKVVEKDRK